MKILPIKIFTNSFYFVLKKPKALSFLLSIAPVVESLHHELKCVLLKFLAQIFSENRNNPEDIAAMINHERLVLFIETLIEDENNEVLLECSNFILYNDYSSDFKKAAFEAQIRVLISENNFLIKLNLLHEIKKAKEIKTYMQVLQVFCLLLLMMLLIYKLSI